MIYCVNKLLWSILDRAAARRLRTSVFFGFIYLTAFIAQLRSINIGAYLAPSVMTYAIQVVAGVVVAIGAVVGIYWRKAKKKVQDKLGIDENTKKEAEDDTIEFTDKEKD